MSARIELDGVGKRYGAVTAVREVHLTIAAGEFLTLLGPSGCGKTTLLRMIAGFEAPTAGRIRLGGEDITAVPPHQRPVNQVFQGYALFPHLTVRGNVAFGLRMRGVAPAELERRVGEALVLVSLEGLGERFPHELSGGQRQRVAVARAVVCRPQVLLLDEPFSALDAKLRQSMRAELQALQRRLGMTFVLVTHDQDEALALSDRIAVVNAGALEQVGSPREIYHRPATAFVADFVGHANLIPAERLGWTAARVGVRLAGGVELEVPAEHWPAGRSSTRAVVRPEQVVLRPWRGDDRPVGRGRVTAVEFRGDRELLQVALRDGGGLTLTAVQPGGEGTPADFAVGTEVAIQLPADKLWFLPAG
ncbi:MAG: ABC transporter ATP-binding protein [Opitutaceae bacterium]